MSASTLPERDPKAHFLTTETPCLQLGGQGPSVIIIIITNIPASTCWLRVHTKPYGWSSPNKQNLNWSSYYELHTARTARKTWGDQEKYVNRRQAPSGSIMFQAAGEVGADPDPGEQVLLRAGGCPGIAYLLYQCQSGSVG